ncbi:MAG: hypothetical protein IKA65_04865 [Lentisphaeria bacterium]|nr:hypothetical protein [Lentisphaeria bacterium]
MQNMSETRRKINEFYERSGKYAPDAYEFVTGAVIEQVNRLDPPRHLSALEVLQGLKKQLADEFGILTALILESWNIQSASDIGEIVFDLINLQILSASAEDKRSDFDVEFKLVDQPRRRRKKRLDLEIPEID